MHFVNVNLLHLKQLSYHILINYLRFLMKKLANQILIFKIQNLMQKNNLNFVEFYNYFIFQTFSFFNMANKNLNLPQRRVCDLCSKTHKNSDERKKCRNSYDRKKKLQQKSLQKIDQKQPMDKQKRQLSVVTEDTYLQQKFDEDDVRQPQTKYHSIIQIFISLGKIESFFDRLDRGSNRINQLIDQDQTILNKHKTTIAFCLNFKTTQILIENRKHHRQQFLLKFTNMLTQFIQHVDKKQGQLKSFNEYCRFLDQSFFKNGGASQMMQFCQQISESSHNFQKPQWVRFEQIIDQLNLKFIFCSKQVRNHFNIIDKIKFYIKILGNDYQRISYHLKQVMKLIQRFSNHQQKLFATWEFIRQKTRKPLKILFQNRRIKDAEQMQAIFAKSSRLRIMRGRGNKQIQWEDLVDKLTHIRVEFQYLDLFYASQHLKQCICYFKYKIRQIDQLQNIFRKGIKMINGNNIDMLLLRFSEATTDTEFQPTYNQYQFFFSTLCQLKQLQKMARYSLKQFKKVKFILDQIQKGLLITKVSQNVKQQVNNLTISITKLINIFESTLLISEKIYGVVQKVNKQALEQRKNTMSLEKMIASKNQAAKKNKKRNITIVAGQICINDDDHKIQSTFQTIDKLMLQQQKQKLQQISESDDDSLYRCRIRKQVIQQQQRQLQFYPQTKICKYLKLQLRVNSYSWIVLPQNVIQEVLYGTYGSKKKQIIIDYKLTNKQLIELVQQTKQRSVGKKHKRIQIKNKQIQRKQDLIYQFELKLSQQLGIKQEFLNVFKKNHDQINYHIFTDLVNAKLIQKLNLGELQKMQQTMNNNNLCQPSLKQFSQSLQRKLKVKSTNKKSITQKFFQQKILHIDQKQIKILQNDEIDYHSTVESQQIQNQNIERILWQHYNQCHDFIDQNIPHSLQKIRMMNQIVERNLAKLKVQKSNKIKKTEAFLLYNNQFNNQQFIPVHKKRNRKIPRSIDYYRDMRVKYNQYYKKDKQTFNLLRKVSRCTKKKDQAVKFAALTRIQQYGPINAGFDTFQQYQIEQVDSLQQARNEWKQHLHKIKCKLTPKKTTLIQMFKDCRPYQYKIEDKDKNKVSQIQQQVNYTHIQSDNFKRYVNIDQNTISQQPQFLDVPFGFRMQIQKKLRQLGFQNYQQFVKTIDKRDNFFKQFSSQQYNTIVQLFFKRQYYNHHHSLLINLQLNPMSQQQQVKTIQRSVEIKTYISLAKGIGYFNMKIQDRNISYYVSLLMDRDYNRIHLQVINPVLEQLEKIKNKMNQQIRNQQKKQYIEKVKQMDASIFKKDMRQWGFQFFTNTDVKPIQNIINFEEQSSNNNLVQQSISQLQLQNNQMIQVNIVQQQNNIQISLDEQNVPQMHQQIVQIENVEYSKQVMQVEQVVQNQQQINLQIQQQIEGSLDQSVRIEPIPMLIEQSTYVDQVPLKILKKYKLRPTQDKFRRPPYSSNQQKIFFNNQVKMFFHNKNIQNYKFQIRRNVVDEIKVQFNPKIDKRQFVRLTKQQLALLDDYQTGKIVFPLKYVYVNKKIGGGFQASRDIDQNQVVAFFNGKILTLHQGKQRQNGHNMMDYILTLINGKIQETVVTTCDQVWGLGPMFNHAPQDKANLKIKGYLTPYGAQYIVSVKRKIIKGQHMTWNYNSGESKAYQMKDLNGKATKQQDIEEIVRKNRCQLQNMKDLVLRYWKMAENYPFEKIKNLQLRQFLRLKDGKLGCSQIYEILNTINLNRSNKNAIYVRTVQQINIVFKSNDIILVPIFYNKNHWMFIKVIVKDIIILQINDSILRQVSVYKAKLRRVLSQITNILFSQCQKPFKIEVNTQFPQQHNQIDCGVFMIAGVREVLCNYKFDGSRISKIRKQLASLLVVQ